MSGNNEPLVSIIVNCYNSEGYLKEALQSILDQNYKNWELIFWDNQSTDRSAEIFSSFYDIRFKYYLAPTYAPLSASRNFAINKATGDYLAFIDCDDLWTPEKLSLQINEFLNNKNVGIVYTLFTLISELENSQVLRQKKYYSKLLSTGHPSKNIYEQLLHQNNIIFSSVMIKMDIFRATDGFNPIFHQNEDYEILLKASLLSDAVCINSSLVKYRIHSGNNSHKNGLLNFEENRIIFNSLPYSAALQQAIKRNETRLLLYKIIYKSEYRLVLDLFSSFDHMSLLLDIAKERFLSK